MDASCQRKGRVLSDDEASPADSNEKYGSNAAECDRQTQPVKDRKIQCARIAPVFLQAAQPRKCKRSSDGDEPVEKLSFLRDDVKEDQLPASSLHSCLEEIQKCNPTFPVPAVFSCLQRKAGDALQQCESTGKHSCFVFMCMQRSFHGQPHLYFPKQSPPEKITSKRSGNEGMNSLRACPSGWGTVSIQRV